MWICLDNLEAALHLLSRTTGTSQSTFNRFQTIADAYPGRIHVRWCPSHIGIRGNEIADRAASAGAHRHCSFPPPLCIATFKRRTKEDSHELAKKLWQTTMPHSYRELGISSWVSKPPALHLPRRVLSRLLAARSGHGDFADYHERFQHEDALLTCQCNKRKSPFHLVYCRTARRRAPGLYAILKNDPSLLFASHNGLSLLAKIMDKTKFFKELCPPS